MTSLLFLAIVVSFIASYFGLIGWIKKSRNIGILWEDMNKFNSPRNVVSSGGVVVVIAFVLGVLTYVAIRTFSMSAIDSVTVEIFSLLSVILIVGFMGTVDDFMGWHHGGLAMWIRMVLAFVAAVPLVVINAGQNSVLLPFFGQVNLGLIYPLFLIPLGIAATTTVYNFLAGMNGIESGLGILITIFLSYVAYITGSPWLSLIGLCMTAALIAFWFFNRNPAKVFPGNALTSAVGALIGCMAILGNFERIAVVVFIPFIIEMILKIRGRFALKNGKWPQSFGEPQRDGSLKLKYGKIYGMTHFSIWFLSKLKKRVYEDDVVYFIYIIQILFILIAFLML
jgi:UDP-N-acetylglucosamine--dolichyl-phosphate N-acetylglucosaminephosphotransferase